MDHFGVTDVSSEVLLSSDFKEICWSVKLSHIYQKIVDRKVGKTMSAKFGGRVLRTRAWEAEN